MVTYCDYQIDHMTSCDARHALVEQLLTQAVTMEQLLAVVKLLQSWPDPRYGIWNSRIVLLCVISSSNAHVTSWGNLLAQLSLQPGGHDHTLLVRAGLEGIPLEVGVVYKQKQPMLLFHFRQM